MHGGASGRSQRLPACGGHRRGAQAVHGQQRSQHRPVPCPPHCDSGDADTERNL